MGTSWRTSVLGYALALIAVVQEMLSSGTVIPHTVQGWITWVAAIIVAVMGRVAKDASVTGAEKPS